MIPEIFIDFLRDKKIPFESSVDLKKKTWIHRGGIAECFVIPRGVLELKEVISVLYRENIDFLLIGCSSNLYIRNTTNIPVVVSTLKCNNFQIKDGVIDCDCGLLVSTLSRKMIDLGVKGFEYLTKLPGTIGAAIYNNSSVKDQRNSITNLLQDLVMITPKGEIKLTPNDLHFDFRSSDLKKHILKGVILKCKLKAEDGNKEELKDLALKNEAERNRILEGPSKNLGCTVHKMFCNGKMPARYRIPYYLFLKVISLFLKGEKSTRVGKKFLLYITGYKNLIPYVSDKQLITFIWRDEYADNYFDDYLSFMKSICMTDKIEIEIV